MSRMTWLIMSVVVGCAATASAQQASCGPLTVYDRVMPITITEAEKHGIEELVVIRYVPGDTSRDREYRIIISESIGGKIVATRYDPVQRSVREQLREAEARQPNATCDSLLAEISIAEHRFENQSLLRRVLKDFSTVRIPARLPASIYLDASRFEVIHWAKMNESRFTVYSAADTANNQLIGWVKRVNARLGVHDQ